MNEAQQLVEAALSDDPKEFLRHSFTDPVARDLKRMGWKLKKSHQVQLHSDKGPAVGVNYEKWYLEHYLRGYSRPRNVIFEFLRRRKRSCELIGCDLEETEDALSGFSFDWIKVSPIFREFSSKLLVGDYDYAKAPWEEEYREFWDSFKKALLASL